MRRGDDRRARMFAGPSAPVASAPRIAPVTTTVLSLRMQVEQERGFLDRVGALDDDDTIDVGREALVRDPRDANHVVDHE